MIILKTTEFRQNIKKYLEIVSNTNDKICLIRKNNLKNIIVISEEKYNKLEEKASGKKD